MTTVREMLLARKKEISSKLTPLIMRSAALRKSLVEAHDEIETLNRELREIHFALRGLDEAQEKAGRLTIMQAVLEVLKHKPEGMTSQEIRSEINAKYFAGSIVRHSLSPQLSRLKDRDKKIELRGNRWFRLPDEPTLFAAKK